MLKRRKEGKGGKGKEEETLITWIPKEIAAKVLKETAEILKEIIERIRTLLKGRKSKPTC